MTVRHFDGVDDEIRVAAGLGLLPGFDGGPGTLVACWRSHNPAQAQGVFRANNAAGVAQFMVNPFSDGFVWLTYASFTQTQAYVDEQWLVTAWTKAGGAAMARSHFRNLATGVWTHVNEASLNDSAGGPVDHVIIGRIATSERLNGDIAGLAFFNREMSDVEVEGLGAGLRSWLDAGPISMWALTDPVGAPLVDLAGGGAGQTAITGTTPVEGEDPPNFSLDLSPPPVAGSGGWNSLLSIYHEHADEVRAEQTRRPVACPNDGEPLEAGPGGVLHCRFDGWTEGQS